MDTSHYKRVGNRVIREIKAAKLTYYPDKIHYLKQANSRQWYSKINYLFLSPLYLPPIP